MLENRPFEIVKLKFPIRDGSELITEVKIFKPNGGVLMDSETDPAIAPLGSGKFMKIAAACSEKYPMRVFEDMDYDDCCSVIKVISDFLLSGESSDPP